MTEQLENIGEWTGKVKFTGIRPEHIDPANPDQTYAYLIVEGNMAEAGIPTGRDGEPGPKGEPAAPWIMQPGVTLRSSLPTYLGEQDKGLAWVVSSENALVYWDGDEYVTVTDVLMPGPTGPRGPQGITGPTGPQGPQGPTGPSSGITTALDFSGTPVDGDTIVYSSDDGKWKPLRNIPRITEHITLPGSALQGGSYGPIDNTSSVQVASMTIPPAPFKRSIIPGGSLMIDHGLLSTVEIEVRLNNDLIGFSPGWSGFVNPHQQQVSPTSSSVVTSSTVSAANILNENATGNITIVAKRKGAIGAWKVDAAKSNLELTLYPRN